MEATEASLPKSNPTAMAFTLTSAAWFAFATTLGMIAAGYLIAPDFLANIEYIHFGRARPMHVNAVLFGFVTPGLLAAAFYYIPKLLRTELFSHKLGVFTAIFWNITVLCGMIGVSLGYTQGREYAELPWSVDIMVVISFALVVINILMTIRSRTEPILYVSIWYITAAVVLTSCTYILGNVIWKPDTGALVGIPDAILLWFYGHNVFGLLLTPMGLGVAYYVLPLVTRNPLYSHTLSLIGFWSLIIVYTHIGTHHLLQVPLPTWLKTIGIVDSIAMVIPVMVVLINLWYTVKGKLGSIQADIAAKFIFTGTIYYFFVNIQGSMMALPVVQRITHYNNWVVGHAHIGVLGFAGINGPGRAVLHIASHHRQAVVQQVPGRPAVLAGSDRHHRFCHRADHRRPDPGQCLVQRRNTLPHIAGNSTILHHAGIAGLLHYVGAYLGLYNIIRSLYFNRGAAT